MGSHSVTCHPAEVILPTTLAFTSTSNHQICTGSIKIITGLGNHNVNKRSSVECLRALYWVLFYFWYSLTISRSEQPAGYWNLQMTPNYFEQLLICLITQSCRMTWILSVNGQIDGRWNLMRLNVRWCTTAGRTQVLSLHIACIESRLRRCVQKRTWVLFFLMIWRYHFTARTLTVKRIVCWAWSAELLDTDILQFY